jgi:uncharacterized protein
MGCQLSHAIDVVDEASYTSVSCIQGIGFAEGYVVAENVSQVARRLIDGLGPEVGVVRVYAYGSRVRGNAEPESDLDLLVELRQVTPAAKRRVLDQAWELSLAEGYVISVVIVSRDAFERGPLSASRFAQDVRREGIEIAA